MVEDSKVVYQAVGKAAGVNVLFDPDYTGKRIQVDLNNVSLIDALRIVGTLSNTFWRSDHKQHDFCCREYALQAHRARRAGGADLLPDQRLAAKRSDRCADRHPQRAAQRPCLWRASQNAIVMRGTPDELLLAQKLVNDLDKARPEVVVDIAVLEVSKNWERTLGIAWPSSAGVALQSPTTTSTTTCPTGSTTLHAQHHVGTSPTLYNLAHLNSNDFAVTIGSATANAAADRLQYQDPAESAHPRHRRAEGDDEDRVAHSHRHRLLSDRAWLPRCGQPLAETQFQYSEWASTST